MRKTLLIISLVTMVALNANAQLNGDRIGIKLGPAIDWASSGSVAVKGESVGMGFGLGIVYDHHLMDYYFVSSGVNLNFLRMNYSFTDCRRVDNFLEEANMMVNRRLKAANIEIPIKFKVKMDVLDSFAAYMEAGGGLGFNCKDFAKDDYSFYWVSSEGQSFVDCSDQYRVLQFSMIFGLGAEYEINQKLSAFAQLTFDHAFSNAFISSLEKQTGSIIRNNYLGVSVGVMY